MELSEKSDPEKMVPLKNIEQLSFGIINLKQEDSNDNTDKKLTEVDNHVEDEEDIQKMIDNNNKLKLELQLVFDSMDKQLLNLHRKKAIQDKEELIVEGAMKEKQQKINANQKKTIDLKKQIDEAWSELEVKFNIQKIITLENDYKHKKGILQGMQKETKI